MSNVNFSNIKVDYTIDDIVIDKSDINGKYAEYWCTLTLKSACYKITGNLSAKYRYYDTGGWILESNSDLENVYFTATAGYIEELAIKELRESKTAEFSYDSLTVIEHNTNISEGKDEIIFKTSDTGIMYDEDGTVTVYYTMSESSGWRLFDSYYNLTRTFHPYGIWMQDYNKNPVEIIDYENEYVNIAKYNIDNSENEYSKEYDSYQIVKKANDDGSFSYVQGNTDDVGSNDYDYYYLQNLSGGYDYVFDKNKLYTYGSNYFISRNTNGKKDKLHTVEKSELNSELSDKNFTYGIYDTEYAGDTTNAISIPEKIFGKRPEEASQILLGEGFGRILILRNNETISDAYTYDLKVDTTFRWISIVDNKFDKGSYLYIF